MVGTKWVETGIIWALKNVRGLKKTDLLTLFTKISSFYLSISRELNSHSWEYLKMSVFYGFLSFKVVNQKAACEFLFTLVCSDCF